MDIAGLSTMLASSKLQNDVSTMMLGKQIDQANTEGAGLVKMIDSAAMELSVNPHIGSNFDMSV